MGWYQYDKLHGNYLKYSVEKMEVTEEAWYENGVHISDGMRDDHRFRVSKFKIDDIIMDLK